jgi:transposase
MTSEERIADLERRLAEALAEIAALRRENAALREENARLRKELEEWKRGHRERSKRRSSRAEGCRKGERKRPGRKAGHPGAFRKVPKPDRTEVHPLPPHCECGGHVEPTGEVESTMVQDIPTPRIENVQHVAPVGRCTKCKKRVVAKLPGAVEAGQSVAEVQLGPNAQALLLDLRYEGRMSLGCMVSVLGTWFGLQITKGGITQLVDRVRDRTEESYHEVVEHIRASAVVGLDETGLRQNGANGWVWLARTGRASLFRVELSRGSWVAEAMLGEGFIGVVCSDFYGVYTAREDWRHGYCWSHTLREAKKIAEVEPTPVTESFRDELSDWYVGALRVQRRGRVVEREAAKEQLADILVDELAWQHPDVERLRDRLIARFEGVTAFLDDRSIPATNNEAEQDIRPLAMMRKVTGGTRSENGSRSLAHWMTVTQTLHKNDLSLREYVIGAYEAHLRGRSPPSVFAN